MTKSFRRRRLLSAMIAAAAQIALVSSSLAQEGNAAFCVPDERSRVIGGESADKKDWPSYVLFRHKVASGEWESFCGGTVIAPNWVLTAAHCTAKLKRFASGFLDTIDTPALSVDLVIGIDDIRDARDDNTFEIADIVRHEDYSGAVSGDDIALVKLDRAWNGPYQVLADNQPGTGTLKVAGFGQISFDRLNPDRRPARAHEKTSGGQQVSATCLHLLTAPLPIQPTDECRSSYLALEVAGQPKYSASSLAIGPGQLCAGYPEGGKDSCFGDSGGPLTSFNDDGKRVQVGIVSWGEGCDKPGLFGVYTSVSRYTEFIKDTIGSAQLLTAQAVPPRSMIGDAWQAIFRNLDPVKGKVSVELVGKNGVARHEFKTGELMHVEAVSQVKGHITIIDLHTDGSTYPLYPKKRWNNGSDSVAVGQKIRIPPTNFCADTPETAGHLIAIVSPKSLPSTQKSAARSLGEAEDDAAGFALYQARDILEVITAAGTGPDSLKGWALKVTDYTIVGEPRSCS